MKKIKLLALLIVTMSLCSCSTKQIESETLKNGNNVYTKNFTTYGTLNIDYFFNKEIINETIDNIELNVYLSFKPGSLLSLNKIKNYDYYLSDSLMFKIKSKSTNQDLILNNLRVDQSFINESGKGSSYFDEEDENQNIWFYKYDHPKEEKINFNIKYSINVNHTLPYNIEDLSFIAESRINCYRNHFMYFYQEKKVNDSFSFILDDLKN